MRKFFAILFLFAAAPAVAQDICTNPVVLRSEKGSSLTWAEGDQNFTQVRNLCATYPNKAPVATVGALPGSGNTAGDCRLVLGDGLLRCWNGSSWILQGGSASHASSHQNGGGDEVSVTGLSGLLADPQTPAAHSHTAAQTTYTPADGADWTNPDPAAASEGLDALAARLTDEEAKADDDTPEVGDFPALALTGPVTSSGPATTIVNDAITAAMVGFNYAASATEGGAATSVSGFTPSKCARFDGSGNLVVASGDCASGDTGISGLGANDNSAVRTNGTGGATAQGSDLIIGDVSGASLPVSTTAGNALAVTTTAPVQTADAQAGVGMTFTTSGAVAGSTNPGAASGGPMTFATGPAARLTSGNADGPNIIFAPGAGIGTGVTGQVVMPAGTAARPGMIFNAADLDTGIYWSSGDTLGVGAGGAGQWFFTNSEYRAANGNGPRLGNAAASATVATLNPNRSANTTGIGAASAGVVSIIATAVEAARFNTVASGVYYLDVTPGASNTGPTIAAAGTGTNLSLFAAPSGTGTFQVKDTGSYGARLRRSCRQHLRSGLPDHHQPGPNRRSHHQVEVQGEVTDAGYRGS